MNNLNEAAKMIDDGLRVYADRGVLRSYHDKKISAIKHEYRFRWLKDQSFVLLYNRSSHRLIIQELFPEVEKCSPMDTSLRRFLKSRFDLELPAHRRIDKDQVGLTCINKNSSVSVAVKITKGADLIYVVNKTVNLISDIFHDYLHQGECTSYVREHFGIPGE